MLGLTLVPEAAPAPVRTVPATLPAKVKRPLTSVPAAVAVNATGCIFEKSIVVCPLAPTVTATPPPPLTLALAAPLEACALTAVVRQLPVTQLATGAPGAALPGEEVAPADGDVVAEPSTHPAITSTEAAIVSRVIKGVRSRIRLPSRQLE
jgi:hypothetical protein